MNRIVLRLHARANDKRFKSFTQVYLTYEWNRSEKDREKEREKKKQVLRVKKKKKKKTEEKRLIVPTMNWRTR